MNLRSLPLLSCSHVLGILENIFRGSDSLLWYLIIEEGSSDISPPILSCLLLIVERHQPNNVVVLLAFFSAGRPDLHVLGAI